MMSLLDLEPNELLPSAGRTVYRLTERQEFDNGFSCLFGTPQFILSPGSAAHPQIILRPRQKRN